MLIIKDNPTFIRLEDIKNDELNILKSILAYKNLNTQYLYNQAKKNKFQYARNPDGWHEYVLKLKSEIQQTALFQDERGYYTYAGLLTKLQKYQLVDNFENKIIPPSPHPAPWDLSYTPLNLYPYQQESVDALLKHEQAAIELPTGSGKTFVAQSIVKQLGLRTLIITPFTAIAHSFYDEFVKAFGKRNVGLYGDGKKQYKQKFVIAIAASLVKVKKDTDDWDQISNRDVVITDESHMIGAPTLASVLLTLCKDIPYRYSVSATQMRGNGTDLLLEGLIGDIVYRKEFQELANEGYLSPLKFRIFNVWSDASYMGTNPLKTKQMHYSYNTNILQLAAEIANMRVKMGESVLVMIDELQQMEKIKNYLNVPYEIASAETNVAQQVIDFNNKRIKLLFGTSAVATGANFKPVETLILLIGGKSEIKYKQAIGRATRLSPGKRFCQIIDFNVQGVNQLERHFQERLSIYQALSDDIEFIDGDE